jgi:gliding motility-associated-like protein
VKKKILLITLLFSFTLFAQNKQINNIIKSSFNKNSTIEDHQGHLITDSVEKKLYYYKKEQEIERNNKKTVTNTLQNAVHLCSNGNFEEFESVSGTYVLKHFQYTTGNPQNPTQCKSVEVDANQGINQYNPADNGLMATTVPSNFIDEYIGNINAFDQYTLKINYKESFNTSGIVQAKRFKTNNETNLKFNYKSVLQSITENGHVNEQPFFKVRIINKNGVVVDEFCTIGDPQNCIFTQAPNLEGGSIVLYTKNWQSGMLNISSIPNNEEFTIEFTASRCGLGGHFGYAYIDDICLLHSDENIQGSIELDPLFKICPTLPISVCGNFTIPNSGGISASVDTITLNVYNDLNAIIYTTTTPLSLDLTTKKFCFEILAANLPNIINGNYNVGVSIKYGVLQTNCAGTNFSIATDDDSNPGWDISFINCASDCNFTLQSGNLTLCDGNSNGKEFFDLTHANSIITGTQSGLTYTYFKTLADATNNTNVIVNFSHFESYTSTIFARVTKDVDCFKIIAFELIVKNPFATISGILNICSGNTTLTASHGVSYLWSNGDITQSTVVTNTGTYSVVVEDSSGCISNASTTILPNQVAVLPTVVTIQPDCFIATGKISVTSAASEYSYDDGHTWTTNSQINNLAVGTYLVKIKTVSGCISYSVPITIIPFLTSFPNFSSINPSSCGGVGSITITTIGSEYSFDDGNTWTTNNTANNLPLGNYLIRVKNEFGCISNFNSVDLVGEFMPAPLYKTESPYCSNTGSITITTPADKYSFDGGNTWQTSNTLDNLVAGSYIIKIKNAQGCTSPNVYVYLNNFEYSYPYYSIEDAGCEKYATVTINTPADFYSFDGGITWSANNILSNLNGGTSLIIMIRKGQNCVSYPGYAYINSYYRSLPVVTNYATLICDDLNNGAENINLTTYNSYLVTNPSSYNFSYYNSLNGAQNQSSTELITNYNSYNLNVTQKFIYIRITDSYGCASIANIEFTLIRTPVINIENKYYLCENFTVTINENSGFDSYLWSDGSTDSTIVISQPGNYSLTVTQIHGSVICSTTKTFPVILSNPATTINFDTEDWTINDNIVTVKAYGLGNYEYSLNGIDYQNSNIFYGLEMGEHKIYVRDKNGCGVRKKDVFLLIHPKFFTPNGDGYNDTWKIRFSSLEPNLKYQIFDQHGKLLKELLNDGPGWDGIYNGIQLPASDYWFVVTRANGKEHKGHFTLKR